MLTEKRPYSRTNKGNLIAIAAVCLGVLALLVAYFVLNYGQLMGTKSRAQSAIDAAALAAANDLSKVVVDGPLGRIALADDSSAKSSYPAVKGDTQNSKTYPMKEDVRPIMSVNTLYATLRLDALIADHPKVKSGSLKYLIGNDLTQADKASKYLADRIKGAINGTSKAYDKFGNEIDLTTDISKAYNEYNMTQVGGKKSAQLTNVNVTGGLIKNAVATNLTTPSPKGVDPQTQGEATYLPYKDYSVPGLNKTVQFLPTNADATILDPNQFVALTATAMPIAVKLEADEVVSSIASAEHGKPHTATLHSVAYALCRSGNQPGGKPGLNSLNITGASGTLVVAFPNGIPVGNPISGTSSGGQPVDFSNIVGIMNASPLDPEKGATNSTYSNWNSESQGIWRQVQGGAIPWSKPDSSSLTPKAYKGLAGHDNDDPSVALSFLVYDWLKTIGLRPSVSSVVSALTFNYQQEYFGSDNTNPKQFAGLPSRDFVSPAYAQSTSPGAEIMAVMTADVTGFDDPRNLTSYKANMEAYNQQQARMWGYVPADGVLPMETMLAALNPDGSVTTVDGSMPSDLYDLLNAIVRMDALGVQTFNNVQAAMTKLVSEQATSSTKTGTDPQRQVLAQSKEELAQLQTKAANATKASADATSLKDLLGKLYTAAATAKDPAQVSQLAPQAKQLIQSLSSLVTPVATNTEVTNINKLVTFANNSLTSQGMTDLAKFASAVNSAKTPSGAMVTSTATNAKNTAAEVATAQNEVNQLQSDLDDASKYFEGQGNKRVSLQSAAKLFAKRKYLLYAWNNAMYCTKVAVAMKNNLRTLTGGGVTKTTANQFTVMGTKFYPPTRAASVEELINPKDAKGVLLKPDSNGVYNSANVACGTGQEGPTTVLKDWCQPPVGSGVSLASALNFFKRTVEPKIGRLPQEDKHRWMLPALAQTSFGNKKYKLVFRVVGGADTLGTGQIKIEPMLTSPYANVPCLQGQQHYQNITALRMTASNDPNTKVDWQVQARDQNVNAFADTTDVNSQPDPNANVKYFTDLPNDALANACSEDNTSANCLPTVAAEWSIFCPLIEAPPITPGTETPPPEIPPAPPTQQPPKPIYPCDSKIGAYLIKPSSSNTGEIVVNVTSRKIASTFTQPGYGSGGSTATSYTYHTQQISLTTSNSGWMDVSLKSTARGNFMADIKGTGYNAATGQFVDGSTAIAGDAVGSYFTFLIYSACNPNPTRNHI